MVRPAFIHNEFDRHLPHMHKIICVLFSQVGEFYAVPYHMSLKLFDHMFKLAEKSAGNVSEVQSVLQPSSKPSKAKTTKAERRALQDAQRAAKAATKGSSCICCYHCVCVCFISQNHVDCLIFFNLWFDLLFISVTAYF